MPLPPCFPPSGNHQKATARRIPSAPPGTAGHCRSSTGHPSVAAENDNKISHFLHKSNIYFLWPALPQSGDGWYKFRHSSSPCPVICLPRSRASIFNFELCARIGKHWSPNGTSSSATDWSLGHCLTAASSVSRLSGASTLFFPLQTYAPSWYSSKFVFGANSNIDNASSPIRFIQYTRKLPALTSIKSPLVIPPKIRGVSWKGRNLMETWAWLWYYGKD